MNLKIFSIICAVAFFVSSHCDAAITKEAQSQIVSALEVTAGYEKPVVGGDVEQAEKLYAEYKTIYNNLQKACGSAGYTEEYTCLMEAGTIVNVRCFVLMDYIIAMDAHKNNRVEQYNEMVATMYRDWEYEKCYICSGSVE